MRALGELPTPGRRNATTAALLSLGLLATGSGCGKSNLPQRSRSPAHHVCKPDKSKLPGESPNLSVGESLKRIPYIVANPSNRARQFVFDRPRQCEGAQDLVTVYAPDLSDELKSLVSLDSFQTDSPHLRAGVLFTSLKDGVGASIVTFDPKNLHVSSIDDWGMLSNGPHDLLGGVDPMAKPDLVVTVEPKPESRGSYGVEISISGVAPRMAIPIAGSAIPTGAVTL